MFSKINLRKGPTIVARFANHHPRYLMDESVSLDASSFYLDYPTGKAAMSLGEICIKFGIFHPHHCRPVIEIRNTRCCVVALVPDDGKEREKLTSALVSLLKTDHPSLTSLLANTDKAEKGTDRTMDDIVNERLSSAGFNSDGEIYIGLYLLIPLRHVANKSAIYAKMSLMGLRAG